MKGKGEKGKSSHNSASLMVEDVQESFANIKHFDHTKHCLKYTSMVVRDEACDYSDLEQLEGELQTMLSSTHRRIKNLNNEVHGLNAWQEKTRIASSPSEQTGQKRGSKGKLGDERPLKRVRTDSGRATYAVYNKGKGKDPTDIPDHNRPQAPKNVTPNRFWAMVDPYCAEITSEDVTFLEEQLKIYGDIEEYMKVPELGRHYTEQWNEEDARMEEKEASKLTKRYSTTSNNKPQLQDNSITSDATSKSDEITDPDCPYGELAQRLVQGLIEQDVMTPLNEDLSMPSDAELSECANMSSCELAQELNVSNSDLLEERLKKELINLGILDENDQDMKEDKGSDKNTSEASKSKMHDPESDDESNDEVLKELRSKQAELKMISAQNVETIKGLLKNAKEEVARGRLRKKLRAFDLEVDEAYKKYQAIKAKKKFVPKKDSEAFFKLLDDRKVVLRQLNKRSHS